jgi:hypothetical protein
MGMNVGYTLPPDLRHDQAGLSKIDKMPNEWAIRPPHHSHRQDKGCEQPARRADQLPYGRHHQRQRTAFKHKSRLASLQDIFWIDEVCIPAADRQAKYPPTAIF